MSEEVSVFGGGCFWCLEAIFNKVEGVIDVVSGYAGGSVENPSYEEVCKGKTGHAEVVKIIFDSSIVSYESLLNIFFRIHNPTTKDREGPDVGSQYRSIILYLSEDQKKVAEKVIEDIESSDLYEDELVTELKPLEDFYEAEEKHQEYYSKNEGKRYCRNVIKPKLEKYKTLISD